MSPELTTQHASAPYSPAPSHFAPPSMADPNVQQSRQQPAAYPSPHSYPSPSMQPTYTYPPPQAPASNEPYRASPQQPAHLPLASLSLPPIRAMDGQQPPPPPQPQQPPPPMGSPLPAPPHGLPQYYPHPAHPHAPHGQHLMAAMAPAQFNPQMRYQLPPQHADQRVLSGGRHKKEIKRRTKTGCLTCRKRRIKCDEAHPVCRNCQKSKRECLGYDPIFKQQPGPAQIQPAPNAAPPPHPTTPSGTPTASASATYSQSPVPQGYAPASSSAYAPAASATTGAHPPETFNAIDPALAAPPGQVMHHGQPHYNGAHPMDPAMRGPPGGGYAHPPPMMPPTRGKPLTMSDIFGICNHSPPEVPIRQAPIPLQVDDEFRSIFVNDYCQGLDMMLQTNWFTANDNALNRIFADRALHEEAAYFTECMRAAKSQTSDMSGVFSQEARLIWHLLSTCKHPPPATNGVHASGIKMESEDASAREVQARFDILECLLTNQNLVSNPLRELHYPPDLPEPKKSEVDFWVHLGDFVQYSGSDSAPPGAANYALSIMRNVLQVQEVRDAIYSIAIARHCGSRTPGFPNGLPPVTNPSEDSDLNKLTVAMSFISHESRQGSQQVLARVCDMAMLSWEVARAP
ncbi:hypothetical protein ACEQ8H_001787 [Pleosporales sp. CAS-2024a]